MHIDLSFEPLVPASEAQASEATADNAPTGRATATATDGATRKRRPSDVPEGGGRADGG